MSELCIKKYLDISIRFSLIKTIVICSLLQLFHILNSALELLYILSTKFKYRFI